jgi:octopine/nopaline transport system permease protein
LSFLELMRWGRQGWLDELTFAALLTLSVAMAGFIVGLCFGALGAAAKLSGSRVARAVADAYTTVLRGVPELLVIYLFYFGGAAALSAIGRTFFGTSGFISLPGFIVAALALGLVSGAYQTEVLRGGYLASPRGEIEAARACGMSGFTLLRRVVVPQVLRYALPGLGNVWQLIIKESALVSVIGLAVSWSAIDVLGLFTIPEQRFADLLRQAQQGAGSTRQPFTFFLAAAALYLVLTTASTYVFARAEQRAMRGFRRV